MSALQMWLAVLIGWLDRQEREALDYLIEENRVLRAQLGSKSDEKPPHDRITGHYGVLSRYNMDNSRLSGISVVC